MFGKIRYWLFCIAMIVLGAISINEGMHLIFSSPLILIASIFSTMLVNALMMQFIKKGKSSKVDRNGVAWIAAHEKMYKYPILLLIWISQLSIFAYIFTDFNERFQTGTIFIEVLFGIVAMGLISLGKRK